MKSFEPVVTFFKNLGIGSKLIGMMSAILILVVVLLSVVAYRAGTASIKDEATDKLAAVAELKTQTIINFLKDRYGDVHIMTGTDLLKKSCEDVLKAIRSSDIDPKLGIREKRKMLAALSPEYRDLKQYINKYKHSQENFAEIKFVAAYDIQNRRNETVFKEGDQILSVNDFAGNVRDRGMFKGAYALMVREKDGTQTEKYDCPFLYSSSIEHCSELNKSSIHMSHAIGRYGVNSDMLNRNVPLQERFSMMMIFDINTASIDSLLADTTGMGETGDSFLIEKVNGRMLMLSNSRHMKDAGLTKDVTDVMAYEEHLSLNEHRRGAGYCKNIIYEKEDGTRVLGHNHIVMIGEHNVGLITHIDESEVFASTSILLRVMMVLGLVVTAAAVGVSIFFGRSISRSIRYGVNFAGIIASGDFTVEIDKAYLERGDELGQLARAMNTMSESLNETMSGIMVSARNLNDAVQEISSGNENLSQRTSEQASSLEEIASSVEESVATIQQNAENTEEAKRLSMRSRDLAESGNKIINEAIFSINDINDSSKKIGEIILLINDLAFQTNLLALNAAVEAARAGDHGRGFAIVASEVRNLALKSANASKDIELLINESIERIGKGTRLSNQSGESLREIINAVDSLSKIISEIAVASTEQKDGIGQINIAVTEMDSMTQQNASLVEEIASSSEEMSNMANELMLMMGRFKINE